MKINIWVDRHWRSGRTIAYELIGPEDPSGIPYTIEIPDDYIYGITADGETLICPPDDPMSPVYHLNDILRIVEAGPMLYTPSLVWLSFPDMKPMIKPLDFEVDP